jgi:hypothetical protein
MEWIMKQSRAKIPIAALATIALCVSCGATNDPIGRTAQRFNVPRNRVIALAKLLGVDPQKINDFATDSPFPSNYFGDFLQGPPPSFVTSKRKSDVLAVVKGYAAMCVDAEGYGHDSLWYFFYSNDVVPPYEEEIPLVLVVHFVHPPGRVDPDPLVGSVNMKDVLDGSVANPPWDTAYQECIDKRGKLGVIPE